MRDIQNERDMRDVPLQKVGVRSLEYPVQVLDKTHRVQRTTATVDLFVNLAERFKGTHMSRFVELFHQYHTDVSLNRFLSMLEELRVRLSAQRAYGTMTFPYFIEKKSPVTNSPGMVRYTCTYEGQVDDSAHDFFVSVAVPVTTLCPCSKAISDYGAHNQLGVVRVKVLYSSFFWIEDLIAVIERAASGSLYAVLKRPDEKWVTEHAYDNPRFVEDVVREVYVALRSFAIEKPFLWFSVEAENFESIHCHNAYAYTEYGAKPAASPR